MGKTNSWSILLLIYHKASLDTILNQLLYVKTLSTWNILEVYIQYSSNLNLMDYQKKI